MLQFVVKKTKHKGNFSSRGGIDWVQKGNWELSKNGEYENIVDRNKIWEFRLWIKVWVSYGKMSCTNIALLEYWSPEVDLGIGYGIGYDNGYSVVAL